MHAFTPRHAHSLFTVRLAVVLGLAAFGACVPPTNPFDPNTPVDQQAPAALRGIIAIDDPSVDDATRVNQLASLRVGLRDDTGARVQRDGANLAVPLVELAPTGGRFALDELTVGTYTLVVDNAPSFYRAPELPTVTLVAGDTRDLGTLEFVAIATDGGGPGRIFGDVLVQDADAGQRKVTLYRRGSSHTEQVASVVTAQDFAFEGLAPGLYAVVAEAPGFAPDHRLELSVGEGGDALLAHDLSAATGTPLTLVSAARVLAAVADATTRVETGGVYVRGDALTAALLAPGGATGVRLSSDARFVDSGGAALPFDSLSAARSVSLNAVDGAQTVVAQFEARSAAFAFTTDIFTLPVVRDTAAPAIAALSLPGLLVVDGATLVNVAAGTSPGARVEASDSTSGIDGVSLQVLPDGAAEPLPVFTDVTTAPGLARVDTPVAVPEDGAQVLWASVRDRAGNVSAAARLPLLSDHTRPDALPIVVQNVEAGFLRTRTASIVFDTSGATTDLPVAMVFGTEPLDPSAAIVPFPGLLQILDVQLPDDAVDGTSVTFQAALIDAAGNTSDTFATSGSIALALRSKVSGSALLAGAFDLGVSHAGTLVELRAANGALLASTTTDATGVYALIDVPEQEAATLQLSTPGWSTQRVALPVLPALGLAAPPVDAGTVELPLLTGSLRGVFRLADLAGDDTAHGNIRVEAQLLGSSRTFSVTGSTGADGSYLLRDIPATQSGEVVRVVASHDDYTAAQADSGVLPETQNIVNADSGVPVPVLLARTAFDFDVCAPGPVCTPAIAFNTGSVRVRLRDTTNVTQVRARARAPFGPSDVDPPFVAFPPGNDLQVDISGAEGLVEIAVQVKRADGSSGDVLRATVTRDTVPPDFASLQREQATGAFDARFTRFEFADLAIDASAGSGAVAPLAPSRVVARTADATPAAAQPPADAQSCAAAGGRCRVVLPGAPGGVFEGAYAIDAWACDAAGNCSAPRSTSVVYDVTPPSAAHGVALSVTGDVTLDGSVAVLRTPLYGLALQTGAALAADASPVVDGDGAPVADVFAARFSRLPTTSDATVRALDPAAAPGDVRTDVVAPPLPAADGDVRIYAQLFDAAGNATTVEPNAFFVDLRVDSTPPAVAFVLAGGASFTASRTVPFDVLVAPGGEVPIRLDLAFDGGLFGSGVDSRVFPLAPGGETLTLPNDGDGFYAVFARVGDAAGNVAERQDGITLDTTGPSIGALACTGCRSSNGQLFANSASVTLAVTANDVNAVAAVVVTRTAGAQSASTEFPWAGGSSTTLSVPLFTNAQNTVTVTARDVAGNVTPVAQAQSLTITHDDTAPAFTAQIAGGAAVVNSPNVPVTLAGVPADAQSMQVSSTATFTGPVLAVATSFDTTLVGADGQRAVFVRLTDAAGNSADASDDVTLDTQAPTGSLTVQGEQNGRVNTASISVQATLGGATQLFLGIDPLVCGEIPSASYETVAGASVVRSVGPAADGSVTVVGCFKDAAGNLLVARRTTVVDTAAPSAGLALDGGAVASLDTSVTAQVVGGADIALAAFVEGPLDCATATLAPFTQGSTPAVALSAAAPDGVRTVTACFADLANNRSSATDTILLDRADPSGALLVNGGADYVRGVPGRPGDPVDVTATFAGLSADVVSTAIAAADFSCATASYTALAAVQRLTLAGPDSPTTTVTACLRDAAGRTAKVTDTFVLDRAPPTGAVTVNAGADTVAGLNVTAALSPSVDAAAYAIAPTLLSCETATYVQPIPATVSVTLPGAGPQTVFACFKDAAGNSVLASDGIFADISAVDTLVAVVQSGAAFATSRTVGVQLFAPADATQMRLGANLSSLDADGNLIVDACESPVGYIAFNPNTTFTLAADGPANVGACVKTSSGRTLFAQDDITVDTVLPTGTVAIAGGAARTKDATVVVNLTFAADVSTMAVSNAPALDCATAAYAPASTTQVMTLPGPDNEAANTIRVCLKDAAGNTALVSDDIIFDRLPPQGVLVALLDLGSVPAPSAGFLLSTAATARLTLGTGTTQVAVAEGLLDCASATFSAASGATVDRALTLSAGDATKTVTACFKDSVGNIAAATGAAVLDTASPTGRITLAGGAALTTLRDVNVAIEAPPDVHAAAVAEAATLDCASATYQALVTSSSRQLTAGDGTKTVVACLKDDAGRTTLVSDTIVLDQTRPSGTIAASGSGDPGFTNSRTVTLALTRDNVETIEMAFADGATLDCTNAAYTAFAPSATHTVPSGDGAKQVALCLRDRAGNVSLAAASTSITLDTAAPTGSLVLAAGAAFTTASTVALALTFSADATRRAIANDGLDCSSASYTALPGSSPETVAAHALTPGDGSKLVAACLKDRAGNTALVVDTVALDTVAPTGSDTSFTVNNGATFTSSRTVTLRLSAPADVKQVAVAEGALDCSSAVYAALVSPQTFTLTSVGEGDKPIRACFKEDAGRTLAVDRIITLDSVAPTVSTFLVNGVAAPVTSNPVVTVTVAAAADAIEMALSASSLDCSTAGYTALQPTTLFTVTAASTSLSLCVRDRAGNTSPTGANVRTVTLDQAAPPATLVINGGASFALSTSATLTLNVVPSESALTRAVANDAIDCATATFAALTVPATIAQTLTAGDGTKTVSACVKDAAGNVALAQDSIVLDTQDPIGTLAIVDPEGNSDGFASSTSTVTLALTLPGEVAASSQMAIREVAALDCTNAALVYEAFASTKVFPLSGGQGRKSLIGCFKDAAGRVTPSGAQPVASIVVDTVAPGGTVTVAEGRIVAGTHFVNSQTVTVTLSGVSGDVVGMAVAQASLACNSGALTYVPFSATAAVTLTAGEGDKTIEVCLRDAAGLAAKLTKAVRLDQTAPAGSITLDGGAAYSTDTTIDVRVTSAEANLELKVPAADCQGMFNIAPFDGDETASPTISALEGTRTLGACLRDPAGNTAFLEAAINVDLTNPVGLSAACASCATDDTGALFSPGTDIDGNGTQDAALLLGDIDAIDPNANGYVQSIVAQFDFNGDGDSADTILGAPETQVLPYDAFATVLVTPGDNTKTLHLFFRDAAGRTSAELDFDDATAGIQPLVVTLDRNAPNAGVSFTVTGTLGDGTASTSLTATPFVTLAFGGGADITDAIVTEAASFAGLSSRPIAEVTGQAFALSSSQGSKTLRAQLIDHAGNTTTLTATPSITFDNVAPVVLSFLLADTDSGSTTQSNAALVNATQSVVPEASLQMRHVTPQNTGDDPEAFVAFAASATVTVVGATPLDQTAPVILQVRDPARNVASIAGSIVVDRTAPSAPTVSIESGATVTKSASVRVDVGTGATRMRTTTIDTVAGTSSAGPVVAYQPSSLLSLPSGDCLNACKRIEVRLVDDAGNESAAGADTISYDTTAPSGVAIAVAGGAATTSSLSTTVAATYTTGAGQATQLALGVGIDCASAAYTAFTALGGVDGNRTTTLSFPAGEGTRTAMACFKDDAGNIATATDDIIVDTVPPSTGTTGVAISLASGAAKTRLTNGIAVTVTLGTGASDAVEIGYADRTGLAALPCSGAGAPAYVALSAGLTVDFINATNQTKRVEACFKDAAGNVTATSVSDTITLDSQLSATGVAVVLSGTIRTGSSATLTRSPVISVDVTGEPTDVVLMRLANEATFAGVSPSSALPLAANARSHALTSGDGAKTVYVELTDDAGNTISVSATITLDTTAPFAPSIVLKSGDALTGTTAVPVALSAVAGATDGTLEVALDANADVDFIDAGDTAFTSVFPTSVTVPATQGLRQVFAKFRDLAGNETTVVSDAITLDSVAPCATASSFTLTGLAASGFASSFSRDSSVTVNVTCTGETATKMRVNCNGTSAASEAVVPFQPTFVCALEGADGLKDVSVDLLDDALNARSTVSKQITLDTTAPVSPTLTVPGSVASGVNNACARIGTTAFSALDTNIDKAQARVNGGAFFTCTTGSVDPGTISGCFFNTSTNKVSVNLAQDRDNLIETRASDKAGNVGEASALIVPEVSSALLPTSLVVKQVCGTGTSFILKDNDVWPATMGTIPEGSGAGANDDVFFLAQPTIELVNMDTLDGFRFDSAGGLAETLGRLADINAPEDWTRVSDVACANDSTKVLFTVWADHGGADSLGTLTLVGINSPLTRFDTLGASVVIGELDSGSQGYGLNAIDVINWTNAATGGDFSGRALIVDTTFAILVGESLRQITISSTPTLTIDSTAREAIVTSTRRMWGLATNSTNAVWLVYDTDLATDQWDVRRNTSAAGAFTSLFSFATSFGSTDAMWHVRAHPASFAHRSTGSFGQEFLLADVDGQVKEGLSTSTVFSDFGSGAPAYQPFAERDVDQFTWVDDDTTNEVVLSNTFTSTTRQQYRYPIDSSLPILSTGRTAAGDPVLLFHTRGAQAGVVVGYSDEAGCFNN